MPLEELLTDGLPFGPIDQALIDDQKDAVDILGMFGPLPSALSGNYTLVYGRKGCGKSAVISMLQGFERVRWRLEREHVKPNDVYHNSIFLAIKTWREFLNMNTHVQRHLLDLTNLRSATQMDYELIPPEVVETAWINEIWDHIFQRIYDISQDGQFSNDGSATISHSDLQRLKSVLLCFDDEGMARQRGTPEYIASKIFQSAKQEVIKFLIHKEISICILFDSMEKYPIYNDTFGLSISGFLRAINKLTTQHNKIKIVFTLPEEIIPMFRANSANILKDFSNSYAMRWFPADLLRIAAHRYRLFLQIHDNAYFTGLKLSDDNLNDRSVLSEFYDHLFPTYITNTVGVQEGSRAYILRHTLLLPRHILLLLNRIAGHSHEDTRNWRQFTERGIVTGVQAAENEIAEEILHPYESIYRDIKSTLNKVLGDLPPIFPFGDLHKCINRIKDAFGLEHYAMIELLYRIGIIGRVCRPEDDGTDNPTYKMYTMADFFFNSPGNISFSGADTLCFHPVFSRYYNSYRHRTEDTRIIYPRGIKWEF
jgi:energy-coupling factor transporter ATP-binding protein EcfA2